MKVKKANPSFASVLKREVAGLAESLDIKQPRAFLVWLGRVAFELSDEEAMEATAIEGANDKGIDLFSIDHEEGKVIIVQGKYSPGGTHSPKARDVGALQGSLQWLSSPEALRRDGKPDLATAAEEYLAAVKDGYGIELWFAYCGPKCANTEKTIAVFNGNPENFEARRACRNCDISLLQVYHEQSTGDIKRLKKDTLSLVKDRHFEYRAKFGEALIATVPATELVRLYTVYGDRLFDRNVRLFLGAKKGSVNAVIAETLKGKEKHNFWAYNNGVTFVCSEFELKDNSVSA